MDPEVSKIPRYASVSKVSVDPEASKDTRVSKVSVASVGPYRPRGVQGHLGVPGRGKAAQGYRSEPRHPRQAACRWVQAGASASSESCLPVGRSGVLGRLLARWEPWDPRQTPCPCGGRVGRGCTYRSQGTPLFPYWIRGVHGAPHVFNSNERECMFKRWRVLGTSGYMETMAKSRRRAIANIRWRLQTECGLSRYAAQSYDLSDIREIE